MSNNEKGYLKKNVLGMSFTSLLTDVSSESVYAVLPFYILSLGYGREIIGLIDGAGELVSSIFKLLSGYIAERVGKYKSITLLGYLLSNIVKPFYAFTRHWIGIMTIKIIDRLGKGIRTSPRDTLLAESAGEKYRGRAFGLHRAMDTIGAVIGPLTAALLLPLIGYTGVFYFSIIPGLLAILILYIYVEEVKTKHVKKTLEYEKIPSVFWLFMITVILTGLSGYTQSFLLVRSEEVGWSRENAILLLTMANIIYASLAYPIGYASDVFKRVELYPVVFMVMSIGALLLGYSTATIHAVLFFAVYGVYMAFHDTLIRIITSRIVVGGKRARAYGYMHGGYGLSALIGHYIVGYMYQYIGVSIAFTYTAIIGLIGLILSIILVSSIRRIGV